MFVWARKQQHPVIRRNIEWSKRQVLKDLQDMKLVAYAFMETTGIFHRVVKDYWVEYPELTSTLTDIFEVGNFSPEMEGRPIYVFDSSALPWLIERDIDEANPAYPEVLRSRPISVESRLPSEDEIRAKMIDLCNSGHIPTKAAKIIRTYPGFEKVGNSHARRTYVGVRKPGRPKKNK
jgi:hypothetical protein